MILDYKKIGSITSLTSGVSWNSSKMEQEVTKRASFLISQNISSEDKIVIFHGGEPEFFADLFSIWSIGACAICLNPKTTINEFKNIYEFVNPAAILVIDKSLEELGDSYNIFDLSKIENVETKSYNSKDISMNNDALILFTSGTTGIPKGVVHSYKSLAARLRHNLENIPKDNLENSLCLLPMHFGHGLIGNCLTPLASEQNLFVASGNDLKNISSLGDIIDTHEISFLSSVPSLWKLIFKLSKKPIKKTLKRIHVGSAPLSKQVWNNIATWSSMNNVVNMYGITETANWISGASSDEYEPQDGLIGKMWGGAAYVLGDDGKINKSGKGVILLDTPSQMKGYFKLDNITDEFMHDKLFVTGDIGTIDEDGTITITGREKFEINRAGMKINPEDLDLLLEGHDSVDEACAFAIKDELFGEVPGIAIKINDKIKERELKAWCATKIIAEKIPSKWFVVDEIPKNDRGKVDRLLVAKRCLNEN